MRPNCGLVLTAWLELMIDVPPKMTHDVVQEKRFSYHAYLACWGHNSTTKDTNS
jgi:hypothetical protein